MIHDVRSDGRDLIGRLGKVVIIQESDCSAMHVHRTRPFVKLCNSMSLQMEAADSDDGYLGCCSHYCGGFQLDMCV